MFNLYCMKSKKKTKIWNIEIEDIQNNFTLNSKTEICNTEVWKFQYRNIEN